MRLSTRNQLTGTITEVNIGSVMATVKAKLDGGDQVVTSSSTKEAALELELATGEAATVFVKSTDVMIGIDKRPKCPSSRSAYRGRRKLRGRRRARPTVGHWART
jgi:molybdopterin-binding protein